MAMAKRWIALLLFLTMIFGLFPAAAFSAAAEEITSETEPAQTESVETELAQTEPVQTEPVQTEPVQTESAQTEPVQTEPVQTEPAETESAETEPAQTEPAQTEPAQTEPAQTEPAQTEPAQTEPVEGDSVPSVADDGMLSLGDVDFQQIKQGGESVWFSFAPEKAGCYRFHYDSVYELKAALYDSDDMLIMEEHAACGFAKLSAVLKSGQEYRLCLQFTDPEQTGEVEARVYEENQVDTTTRLQSYIDDGCFAQYVCYTAETSDYYAFSVECDIPVTLQLFDGENRCLKTVSGSGTVYIGDDLIQGNIYMLKIGRENDGYVEPLIGLVRHAQLQADTRADVEVDWYGHEAGFLFAPETSAVYAFYGSAEASTAAVLCDINGNELASGSNWSSDSGPYFFYPLVGGEQYLLTVDFANSSDSGTISVLAEKIPEMTGDAAVAEIDTSGEAALFVFEPAYTDRYILAWESDYLVSGSIYSEDGSWQESEHISSTEKAYILEGNTQYVLEMGFAYSHQLGDIAFCIEAAHDYEDAEEIPAGCTEEGLRTYTCIYCQELVQEVIPATHEYDNGACIHCGELYIVELKADSYNNYVLEASGWNINKAYFSYTPKYTESYIFTSMTGGDTVGYLYDSSWNLLVSNDDDSEGNTDFSITYTMEAGKTYYLVSERYLGDSDWDFAVRLTVDHDFESVTVPATCLENGSVTSVCRICGYRSVKTLYADHVWDDGVVEEAYSCEVEGSILYTCTVCAETMTEWMGGYGHSYDESIYCNRCGKVMEDSGTCGDRLTWKVDSTQTLTISGTGDMDDFGAPPWDDYLSVIRRAVIEEGVTAIGDHAFYNADELEELSLPESLQSIGEDAFWGCGLKSIYIPASMESISPRAFRYSYELKELKIDENNLHYSMDETGAIYNKEKTVLYAHAQSIYGICQIPDGVTSIETNAFQGSISCLVIPGSVQNIVDHAFIDGLSYDAVIRFEGDAPSFGDNAFAGEYEWDGFEGKIYYPGDNETWTEDILLDYGGAPQWIPISGELGSGSCGEDLNWVLDAEGTLTITGTGPMDDFGYDYSNGDIETHTERPWEEYKNLIRKAVLPDGITRIGNEAFLGCSAMQAVNLPDTVTRIGTSAFERCESLASVEIPVSLQDLGAYGAFFGCSRLVSVTLPEGLTVIPESTFGQCSALEEVRIPNSVREIEADAFVSCSSLKQVTLPAGVTFIGQWAFQNCTSLTQINIPSSVKTIDSKAFRNCPSLTEIELPEGLVSIADGAFYGCTGLTEIKIPSTVKKIGWGAFAGCTGLTEVVVPDGVGYLGGTFWGCTGLTRVTIPDSVTNIAYWAFRDCTSLKELKLPENLQFIGDGVFADSTVGAVTFPGDAPEFAIPGSVTDSVYGAFLNSTALTTLEAPETLQSIGEEDASAWAVTYPRYDEHVGTFGGASAVAYYPGDNATWTEEVLNGDYGGNVTWAEIGAVKNRVMVEAAELGAQSVWIDGREYAVQQDGDRCYVDLPDSNAATMITYAYHSGDESDVHTQYPVSMKVWILENENGFYTAVRAEALDDILQYAGSSIRVTGNKGIRMITAVDQNKKNALTADGLTGYTLQEYGTVISWASRLNDRRPLILGQSYSKSNYAYKRDVADPVFAVDGSLMQYTNVLVGFRSDQCGSDIAMRPYMILEDEDGRQITLYGGIVQRSIGYIAYQNRNVFESGTEAYEYIWGIIHGVYGDAYDEEYVG